MKIYINGNKEFSLKINVPFCPESKLSGIENVDFMNAVWYRKNIDAAPSGKRTLLHFGAVDYRAKVFVNGTFIGEHKGGYSSFSFDITDYGVENKTATAVLLIKNDKLIGAYLLEMPDGTAYPLVKNAGQGDVLQ